MNLIKIDYHFIHKVLKLVLPEEFHWKLKIFENWELIIGSLKNKVRIEKIEDDLLVLGVTHPSWAQELYFLSNVILDKVNSLFDTPKIKNIRFQVIGFKTKIKKKESVNKIQLKEYKEIPERKNLLNIKDRELRQELLKYYEKCFHK